MRDSVVAALRVVHGESKGVASLPADVAEWELVEACVDSFVTFVAPVLERGNSAHFFSVCKADPADVLVIDLKLWVKQLDQSHFFNQSDVRFFENLCISDCAP